MPDQKRTYGVNVKADLSTRFADWIETNLLKVDTGQDPQGRLRQPQGRVRTQDGQPVLVPGGETVTIDAQGFVRPLDRDDREAGSQDRRMEGLPTDQEPTRISCGRSTDALGDLKIVGVRPKPPGLTDDLNDDPSIKLDAMPIVAARSRRGFYPVPNGRLFSNQGDVIVTTDEGVVYTLRYGEAVFATGEN